MKTDRECVSVMNFNPPPPCFKLVYMMNKCKLLKNLCVWICVCKKKKKEWSNSNLSYKSQQITHKICIETGFFFHLENIAIIHSSCLKLLGICDFLNNYFNMLRVDLQLGN